MAELHAQSRHLLKIYAIAYKVRAGLSHLPAPISFVCNTRHGYIMLILRCFKDQDHQRAMRVLQYSKMSLPQEIRPFERFSIIRCVAVIVAVLTCESSIKWTISLTRICEQSSFKVLKLYSLFFNNFPVQMCT